MKRSPESPNGSFTTLSTSDGEQSPRKRRRTRRLIEHDEDSNSSSSSSSNLGSALIAKEEILPNTCCRLCSASLVGKSKSKITPCMHEFCFTCLMRWEGERRKCGETSRGCPYCISVLGMTPSLDSPTASALPPLRPSYTLCPHDDCKLPVVNMKQHLDKIHARAKCPQCFDDMDKNKLKKHMKHECSELLVPCINQGFGCLQYVRNANGKMTDDMAYEDHHCMAVVPCILCTPMRYVGQGRDGWMHHNQMHSMALTVIKPEPASVFIQSNEIDLLPYDFY